ncbi:MAG: FHA domain-containing protein, partial [Bdellovibrionales bacterium]
MLLKGLEGPYKDRYFVLKAGMTIGRKAGDILLEDDPMVSSLHGRIIGRGDGRFMLEDAGSQNQFLVNGLQMPKVDLNEGVIFQVGQSVFEVFSARESDLETLKPEKSWKELIFDLLEKNHNVRNEAKPLNPAVRVDCTQG